MFKFEIVGFVKGSYTSKEGIIKPYTKIYCQYPLDEQSYTSCSVSGYGADILFLNRVIDDIELGDIIQPIYSKYGKCVDIINYRKEV